MKILFIIPPYGSFENYNVKQENFKVPSFSPPYGILSLISYVNEDMKHNFQILDLGQMLIESELDVSDFKDYIIANIKVHIAVYRPDYIGISALFDSHLSHLRYIVPTIKEFDKRIKILVGGGLPTGVYNRLLEEIPEIDALCYGEGEIPFKKLLESGSFSSSPAWITKESLKNNVVPRYDFVEDLDEIPIINFDYVELDSYNDRSPVLINSFGREDKVEMNIHTSRGCPFNCVFCGSSITHGKKIRFMSIERIRETIEHYVDRYGMNVLLIEDDNLFLKKNRVLKVLEIIKEFNVRIEIPIGVAVYGIDDDVSKALYEAGARRVSLAIESGSDYVLKKIMDKPITKEQIYKAVASLKKFNIGVHAFIVTGLPGEFTEHRKETWDMLIDLEIDWVHIFIAMPITGSRLYKICEDNGYLVNNTFDGHDTRSCVIKAPGVDPELIKEEVFYMNMVINYIANSNYRNGNYEECLSYFHNIAKMYPNNAVVHYMIYKILTKKDEYWNSMFRKFKNDGLI